MKTLPVSHETTPPGLSSSSLPRHAGRWVIANVFALAACVFPGETATAVQDEGLLNAFREDYPEHFNRLVAFYSNLRMEGRVSAERLDPDAAEGRGLETLDATWEFGVNGEALRSIVTPDGGPTRVVVSGPELSFFLEKPPGSNAYTVDRLWAEGDEGAGESPSDRVRKDVPASIAPFGFQNETVLDFMARPGFRPIGAREVDDPDGEGTLVEVDWEVPASGGSPTLAGSFRFDAAESWVLRGYETVHEGVRFRDPATREFKQGVGKTHGLLAYDPASGGGIPRLREVRTWTSGPGGRAPFDVVHAVTRFEEGPMPPDAFTLGAFGLGTDPAPEPRPLAMYLLGLAAGCVALALVLRSLRGRSPASGATR